MSNIILYGAGKRGIAIEAILHSKGIQIKAFADSFKGGGSFM